jgi:hypothetical protein
MQEGVTVLTIGRVPAEIIVFEMSYISIIMEI